MRSLKSFIMKKCFIQQSVIVTILILCCNLYANCQSPKRPTRSESFFGLHYDFHANSKDRNIGGTLTEAMVDSVLKVVKPDFIQVDAKGHGGIASYPTKVGIPASDIKKDPMRIFRDVTQRRGVGLYAHFSGLWDAEAIKVHPEWARIDQNGNADKTTVSMFSKYVDNSFIPQIQELSNTYNIDGVWVDGDSWYVKVDYAAPAMSAYKKKYNLSANAKANSADLLSFTRQSYHNYLAHYVTALKKTNPKLEIISNWAYSSFMPGKVDAPVDFLSGDIARVDAFNSAQFESRVFASQKLPWDLMSWGFTSDPDGTGYYFKTVVQLEQESAAVLSQGGAYQIYTNQKRDASLPLGNLKILKQVADFCRARKAFVKNTESVPQVALLFSTSTYEKVSKNPFNSRDGSLNTLKSTLKLLLKFQKSVDIIQEHQLATELSKYPFLVVSEWSSLSPSVLSSINSYVQKGGKVLAIGEETTKALSGKVGKALTSKVGGFLSSKLNKGSSIPYFSIPYGKGKFTLVTTNFVPQYLTNPTAEGKNALEKIFQVAFPGETVTLNGPKDNVYVSLRTKGTDFLVHLVNSEGQHADPKVPVFSEIPKKGNFEVNIKTSKRPSSVTYQPDNKKLNFEYSGGVVKFQVPGLDIYSIVEVKM